MFMHLQNYRLTGAEKRKLMAVGSGYNLIVIRHYIYDRALLAY